MTSINSFIEDNSITLDNYREVLFKNKIFTKEYDDMILLYNNNEYTNNNFQNEMRSVVLDKELKLVCYTYNTPICNRDALHMITKNSSESLTYYNCYEGTTLMVFYHNNKWNVSTRRNINAKTSKTMNDSERSYYDLFTSVVDEEVFFNELDKNRYYIFNLVHHKNQNVIDYTSKFGENYKKLFLIIVRDYEQNEYNVNDYKLTNVDNLEALDDINMTLNDLSLDNIQEEGFVCKVNGQEQTLILKLQTLGYQFYKAIGSEKNIYQGFIYLYQQGKLRQFLKENSQFDTYKLITNPNKSEEVYDCIGVIDAMFKVLTSELFEMFKMLYFMKDGKPKENNIYTVLPNIYKVMMFKVRGIYFKVKNSEEKFLRINHIYTMLKSLNVEDILELVKNRKLLMNLAKQDVEYKDILSVSLKCDKVHIKLISLFGNILFPSILNDNIV